MVEKIDACPFCGALTTYTAPPALGKGRWVVQCDDCRAEGPQSSDNSDAGEAEAIAAWNRRAPTTDALPAGEAADAIAGLRVEVERLRDQERMLANELRDEEAEVADLSNQLAEARAALEKVLATIRQHSVETWWIDVPDRGGFDVEMINAALTFRLTETKNLNEFDRL